LRYRHTASAANREFCFSKLMIYRCASTPCSSRLHNLRRGRGVKSGSRESQTTPSAISGAAQQRPSAAQEPSGPTIQSPKGGGALRAIGEKFSTNAATGAATFTVPLPLSPGRAGFSPSLELRYDTGSGNGAWGVGWQLSLGAITRKTDRGLPTYDDGSENDVFILEGAEDLVPARRTSAAGIDVLDELNTATFRIQRYRPRIETQFARVERWTRQADGDVHWRVTSRDNLTSVYGHSADARIADPSAPARVFSWLLEETRDDLGNAIHYSYVGEDGAGVDPLSISETSRFARDGKGAQQYLARAQRFLKTVSYANKTPLDTAAGAHFEPLPEPDNVDWLMRADFGYGEAAGKQAWPLRQDAFSTFKPGFELRTCRLCHEVTMQHRFVELGADWVPVRSMHFAYQESPVLTYMRAVQVHGFVVDAAIGTRPGEESLPPLEFEYSRSALGGAFRRFSSEALDGIPAGPAGGDGRWVDLNGEGLPGLFWAGEKGWYYKANHSGKNAPGSAGDDVVALTAPSAQRQLPVPASLAAQQLLDLDGNGMLDLVRFSAPAAGAFTREQDGAWAPHKPMPQTLHIDWSDPNLRMTDLDGDGFADVMITRDDRVVWYRSCGARGFEQGLNVRLPADEEMGPRVLFNDGSSTIFLADMNGDGLADLVRIRHGGVVYWPSMGRGRFGPKVTMGNFVPCDTADGFDPHRLRFSDIDGSGTSDLLYICAAGVKVYANQAGNRFADPVLLDGFPHLDAGVSVDAIDLFGRGTACLVWSAQHATRPDSLVGYIDLMPDGKPHLLVRAVNNFGGETRIAYAPSTYFYLKDKLTGHPWVTRLPFPVQCVRSAEQIDHIAQTRITRSYDYHHGYYDGVEREFRGFARVDQRDAEEFDLAAAGAVANNAGAVPAQPPVETRSWYHTGAWLGRDTLQTQLAEEYFKGDKQAHSLPMPVLPEGMSIGEQREATRAMRGTRLREEIYALDGSEHQSCPYAVSEASSVVTMLQPSGTARHAVFHAYQAQTLSYHYERNPADPRVAHGLTLQVDDYGNVLQAAALAYPRRRQAQDEQKRSSCTWTESRVENVADQPQWHRIGVPLASRTIELSGLALPLDGALIDRATLLDAIATAAPIPYAQEADLTHLESRTLKVSTRRYYNDKLSAPLPLGAAGRRALPHRTYTMAFTADLTLVAYGPARLTPQAYEEGGYVAGSAIGTDPWIPPDSYWIPTPLSVPDAARFFVPSAVLDPWGSRTRITHDRYTLNIAEIEDAAGNKVTAQYHYGAMMARHIVDPNGDASEYAFNPMGLMARSARVGFDNKGDSLAAPGSEVYYEWNRWLAIEPQAGTAEARKHPARARNFVREQHGAARLIESVTYTDGSGREVMTKTMAPPGPVPDIAGGAPVRDVLGQPAMRESATRWLASGRVVFDNKGNPVKQYEPYFASADEFETEQELVEWGVSPVICYDPLGRAVRTLFPDGTWTWTEFDTWQVRSWDRNDTVGHHPDGDAGKVSDWLQHIRDGNASGALLRAADLALQHSATPAESHLDILGRVFLDIADNGRQGKCATRIQRDIEGRTVKIADALEREAARHRFDMADRPIWSWLLDSGTQIDFPDCTGQPLHHWTARDCKISQAYDALRRLTHVYVVEPPAMHGAVRAAPRAKKTGQNWLASLFGGGAEPEPAAAALPSRSRLAQRFYYGESRRDRNAARKARQLGKVVAIYDGAGQLENDVYDLDGNLESMRRSLAREDRNEADWSALATIAEPEQAARTAARFLERSFLEARHRHDALGRQIERTTPDRSRVITRFDIAGHVEAIDLHQSGAPKPTSILRSAQHNARGQPLRIEFGNRVVTSYEYEPSTFRVSRIQSARAGMRETLQDLRYTYDPVGNANEVEDAASSSEFFNGTVVAGGAQYAYDALYQIVQSSGREHPAAPYEHADPLKERRPDPLDMQALRRYTETFSYDAVGNLQQLEHKADGGRWTRRYTCDAASNRLLASSVTDASEARYQHDGAGNMIAMPHLKDMQWNHSERLVAADLQGGGQVYFAYAVDGERVRKRHRHGYTIDESIYFDGFEIQRRRSARSGDVEFERETIHVMEGGRRLALFETKTVDDGEAAIRRTGVARFQLGDRLQSSCVELDGDGKLISYEEYHAYGSTAFKSEPRQSILGRKRYRYTGGERDEETKLDYRGARYYAAWLGRWTSADPAGAIDGVNLFRYTLNNPVNGTDDTGLATVQDGICLADPALPEQHPATPDSMREMTGWEGFTTFNPIGRGVAGALHGISEMPGAAIGLIGELGREVFDVAGYLGTSMVNAQTADNEKYVPYSALFQSMERDGPLITAVKAISGLGEAVVVGPLRALYNRDEYAMGSQLASIAAAYGIGRAMKGAAGLNMIENQTVRSATSSGLAISSEGIAEIEQHLRRLDSLDHPPNAAMLDRLRKGESSHHDLKFYEHEIIESDFMRGGLDSEKAHFATLKQQGIEYVPGFETELYHPEVYEKYKLYFNPAGWKK
jgi:RHS repeat-associated protein